MHGSNLSSDETLLGELEALENLINEGASGNGLTAIIRLIRDGSSWPELARQKKLDKWLVLPLGQDKFPALRRLQQHLETLTFQKDHDGLSGLRNRHAFDQALAMELERASRFKSPLSLCIMDLDNFKAVNDTYGHPCGDKVIQAMASILVSETRKTDIAARIGGEEFALILPCTGLLRAHKLLERILAAVREARVDCDQTPQAFTCSMGLASYRGKHVPDPERLMAEADHALYKAKSSGKNRLESAPILDLSQGLDQTLVQQNEKRFLFSSFVEPSDNETDQEGLI